MTNVHEKNPDDSIALIHVAASTILPLRRHRRTPRGRSPASRIARRSSPRERSTLAPALSCSSSAKTFSAPAPSSSAAPTTRCPGSLPTSAAAASLTFSSGNHAQAIALAGQLLDIPRVIVMPSDAPAVKRQATEGYGGEVIVYDREHDDREAIGRRMADERGLTVIPPYDHADVIAGQGTAAVELLEEAGPLDFLLVPCGGGGLLSGSAIAARALAPDCRVIGVEPAAGDDATRSFRTKAAADGSQPADRGRRRPHAVARDRSPSRSSCEYVPRHDHGGRSRRCCRRCSSCGSG